MISDEELQEWKRHANNTYGVDQSIWLKRSRRLIAEVERLREALVKIEKLTGDELQEKLGSHAVKTAHELALLNLSIPQKENTDG